MRLGRGIDIGVQPRLYGEYMVSEGLREFMMSGCTSCPTGLVFSSPLASPPLKEAQRHFIQRHFTRHHFTQRHSAKFHSARRHSSQRNFIQSNFTWHHSTKRRPVWCHSTRVQSPINAQVMACIVGQLGISEQMGLDLRMTASIINPMKNTKNTGLQPFHILLVSLPKAIKCC